MNIQFSGSSFKANDGMNKFQYRATYIVRNCKPNVCNTLRAVKSHRLQNDEHITIQAYYQGNLIVIAFCDTNNDCEEQIEKQVREYVMSILSKL